MKPRDLENLVATTLDGALPQGLKEALDAALAKGASRAELLARVRRQTGGPRAQPGGLTFLAVQKYLEQSP